MATTRIIWTGDSANAPAVANNLYGIDQDTADRLVAALKSADAKRLEIRDDGHLWQVGADGTSIDIGLVNDTGALENIIIGKGAEAGSTAETVVAVGESANADGRQSIAVGARATADGTGSTAVGGGAEAHNARSVALGFGSVTDADDTVSVGCGTDAHGSGSSPMVRRITHVGDPVDGTDAATKKYVDSRNFTVAGAGEDSIAISPDGDAQATERRSIAIGKGAAAAQDSAISIGYGSNAKATGSGSSQVVIGSFAVGGRDSVCIGGGAGRDIGASSPRVPSGSVNVGAGAFAPYSMSVAVGAYAKATGRTDEKLSQKVGSDAYGSHTKATGEASVALGCYSYATESNVVSVGQGDSGVKADGERVRTRRIVNVSDPVNAQDAATKNYVDAQVVSGGYTLPAATASTLGGVKIGDNLTVTEDGTLAVPTATFNGYGVVKPGAGLSITSDGTLSTTVRQYLDTTNSALAIGDGGSKASGGASMAVGLGATATAGNATALGQAATAGNSESVAVGNKASATGSQSTLVGVRASISEPQGVAVGWTASASGWSTAIGSNAVTSGAHACDAFGCNSNSTAGHAVALGASSVADTEWTVSVGNSTNTRRIMHVTDPMDKHDAATKNYVDALEAKLATLTARVAALEAAK